MKGALFAVLAALALTACSQYTVVGKHRALGRYAITYYVTVASCDTCAGTDQVVSRHDYERAYRGEAWPLP